MVETREHRTYDEILLAVAHDAFKALGSEAVRAFGHEEHVLDDL